MTGPKKCASGLEKPSGNNSVRASVGLSCARPNDYGVLYEQYDLSDRCDVIDVHFQS